MCEWITYKLGDILFLEYGKGLKNYQNFHGKFDVFGTNGKIGKSDNFIYDQPSLVIGRKGAYRGVHLAKHPFFVIDTAFFTKSKIKELDIVFLYYWFKIIDINGMDSGSAIPSTSRDEVYDLEIFLPPLPEQKAIASVLSSLDDKIDLLHRQNKTLEAIAETLFRHWFIEEAQADWEEATIGDFVKLNRASTDKNYPYQIIEYLDTGSLTEGKIESFQSFTLDEAPSRAKRLVQHNDVLISTVRPNQKHYGIIKDPIENLVVSTGFCVITCTRIDPHFIYLLLTNDEMTSYLHTIAEGSTSTYPSLKSSDIGALSFQLPPKDKLKDFSAIAHHSWEKIEKNHIQIRTLEKLRDTLLPKLMSGEVRVAS